MAAKARANDVWSSLLPAPITPDLLRRLEFRMGIVRWVAIVWGGVQLVAFYGQLRATDVRPGLGWVAMAVLLAWIGIAGRLIRRVTSAVGAARLSMVSMLVDAAVIGVLVYAFTDQANTTIWLVALILPVEGAYRMQLPGALYGWLLSVVVYVGAFVPQSADPSRLTGIGLMFRLGLPLLVAVLVGLLAHDHAEQRQALMDALSEVRQLEQWRLQMISTLAHDVRGPLGHLTSTAEVLEERHDELEPQQRRELIATIGRQGGRVLRLANDVLDLARSEHGTFTLDRKTVEVGEIVDQALSDLAADDRVVVDVSRDVAIHGDARRLEQVVGNLVSNGLRHGAPPVEVHARQEGKDVLITVRDHGDGLGFDRQQDPFRAFAQGEHAESIGLGLWIVNQIVHAHGGTVIYENADPGARFTVRLPA